MRRLALKKDTLAELSTDDLANVVGGDITTLLLPSLQACPVSGAYPTLPVIYCVTKAGS
ncbi:MAG TPA: class I lanthipeptide [Frankiaceae bacterium]|nr:class I lanthipeptide [Frankiaceae bacterium]